MRTYTAHVSGHSWSRGPTAEFPTITACREWAEENGTTADRCVITDAKGREVGVHLRDSSSNRWFRATI